MDGCAARVAAPSESIWSPEEVRCLSEAEKKAEDVQKRMTGVLRQIVHSPFMVAKYPDVAKLQIRQVGPFNGAIQNLIKLANEQVEKLRLILENLLSPERTDANREALKKMLQEGGDEPSRDAAFVRHALYGAIDKFVEEHREALRDPECNQAIFGPFIKGAIKEPIGDREINKQLNQLRGLQEGLTNCLLSEGIVQLAKICRICDIFLSALDILAPSVVMSAVESLYVPRDAVRKWAVEQRTQVIRIEQKLGRDVSTLFIRDDRSEEDRFKAAQRLANSNLTSSMPVDIRLRMWRCLAENDSRYRGLFKSFALGAAKTIQEFKIAQINPDGQRAQEDALSLLMALSAKMKA